MWTLTSVQNYACQCWVYIGFGMSKVIIEIVSLQILNNSVVFVTKTPVIDASTIFPLWKSDRSDILTYLNVDICKNKKNKN